MNTLCPICDRVLKSYDYGNTLYFCHRCNLFMCSEAVHGYDGNYELHYKLYERTEFSKKLNLARWKFVNKHDPCTVLDFGCGSASFAKQSPKNIRCYSYDPFFKKDYTFLERPEFDVVTFWDSLEHMTRIQLVPLLNAKEVCLSVPITDDVHNIISWKHFRPGEHVWYFSDEALKKLFQRWEYAFIERDDFEVRLGRDSILSYRFVKV